MIRKTVPFDLEKWRNNKTIEVVTGKGEKVEIINIIDYKKAPVLAVVYEDAHPEPHLYTEHGNRFVNDVNDRLDLFMIEKGSDLTLFEEKLQEILKDVESGMMDIDTDNYTDIRNLADSLLCRTTFGDGICDVYEYRGAPGEKFSLLRMYGSSGGFLKYCDIKSHTNGRVIKGVNVSTVTNMSHARERYLKKK